MERIVLGEVKRSGQLSDNIVKCRTYRLSVVLIYSSLVEGIILVLVCDVVKVKGCP